MGKLFQASTLASLLGGNYDYTISIEYFMKNGDMGLGSYNGLNGEAVFLDGKAYNGTASDQVKVMDIPQTGVTFGQITRFANDIPPFTIPSFDNLADLKEKLSAQGLSHGSNYFYMMRAEGTFSSITFRSGYKQRKPFRPMSLVAKELKYFTMKNVEGTLVIVFTPDYADGLSAKGYHIHFLSKDKLHAGHVTQASGTNLEVKSETLDKIEIKLPSNRSFGEGKLTSEDIRESYDAYKNAVPANVTEVKTPEAKKEEPVNPKADEKPTPAEEKKE